MRLISPAMASAAVLIAATAYAAEPICKCRARGVTASLGQTLCIPTPDGIRLARCDKVLNVTSWTFLDGPCPQASIGPGEQPTPTFLPNTGAP